MTIKLVAVDMDDTLLDKSNQISPHTREVIAEAVKQGVTVTIATGRPYSSVLPYVQQLGLDVPLITYNGGLVKRSLSGEVLYEQALNEHVAREVLALFRDRGWYIQAYVDDVVYVEEFNERAKWYKNFARVEVKPIGEQLYSLKRAPMKMLSLAEPEEVLMMQKVVQDMFGDKVYVTISKPTFLEIMDPGVNKGRALAYLAQKLNISREEVMAVGDSNNDLDMIEYAGLGVAMGNAADHIKAVAQAVTCCNDEDGVAEAIKKYVLAPRA